MMLSNQLMHVIGLVLLISVVLFLIIISVKEMLGNK
jgi:hypothetical protein